VRSPGPEHPEEPFTTLATFTTERRGREHSFQQMLGVASSCVLWTLLAAPLLIRG
jgi:threonine/homoserine/homoserine lactone efflux protein